MANGDITHIKELGRITIPGGGRTTSGVPRQNKVIVWGELRGIYVTTGLDLSAMGGVVALGVTTLDFSKFEVKYSNALDPATVTIFAANLATGEDKIYVLDDLGGGAVPGNAEIVVLQYLVIGDSNAAPELT